MTTEEDLQNAANTIKQGGIILYPTDTVWGIGCDARNERAVERIYQIKNRQNSKAMIVLVDSETMLLKHVSEVPNVAWDLIAYSNRPLTIIYDNIYNLADNLVATDGSAGIRICKDAFCSKLIHKTGRPVVSTSANLSGANTPANFSEISAAIKTAVDYVVHHKQNDLNKNKPSVIMRLKKNGEFTFIRQ